MSRRDNPAVREWHVPPQQLEHFAAIDGPPLPLDVLWSVEAHLERCPHCRAQLAQAMTTRSPEIITLVDDVHAGLDARLAGETAPPRPRPAHALLRRLTGGLLISRLAACIAVLMAAALLDLAADAGGSDDISWVLLAAPVLPLVGVAASWSRVLDPAYGLVAATPAAGLPLLLRRTLVMLLVVVPAGLLAGAVTGVGGQAAWLLPSVALSAAAIALGGVMGMVRATWAVAAAWAIGVVAPALGSQAAPAALDPAWAPAWAVLAVAAATVIALRRHAYQRPSDG
jgi:hypothetical protein